MVWAIKIIDEIITTDDEGIIDFRVTLYETPPAYKSARIQLDIEIDFDTVVLAPSQMKILLEFLERNKELINREKQKDNNNIRE